MNTKLLGDKGETIAADYLEKRGYQICARQYHSPMGEIDLIARKSGTIVFVEVKTRRVLRYGTPAQAVNRMKQQRIIQTAYWYVQREYKAECSCRFDVIEVYWQENGTFAVRHFENAFEVRE